MKRITPISVAVVIFICAAFFAGLKVGLDKGMDLSFYVDAPARGAIATQQLNALRSGKTDFVITSLEFSVDQCILWHNDLLNSNWAWLLGSDKKTFISNSDEYMRRIAQYRQQHPSPTEPTMFDVVPPGKEQLREEYQKLAKGIRENRQIIDAIVARYAK
jgi:hypothetical protein